MCILAKYINTASITINSNDKFIVGDRISNTVVYFVLSTRADIGTEVNQPKICSINSTIKYDAIAPRMRCLA